MEESNMKTTEFQKVVTVDFYKEMDGIEKGLLDHLEDGYNIEVKWDDGSITEEILLIKKGRGSAQVDMCGSPDVFPTKMFYINKEIRGHKVSVPLRGMYIRGTKRI